MVHTSTDALNCNGIGMFSARRQRLLFRVQRCVEQRVDESRLAET
jgi:hypothetical protein